MKPRRPVDGCSFMVGSPRELYLGSRLNLRRQNLDGINSLLSLTARAIKKMPDPTTVAISVLALGVSAVNAWLTLFRRGTIKMTQPTIIFFGPDGSTGKGVAGPPKVYLRTLLFSTSKRGRVIQSMHVSLRRNETLQNFNIWVHGDDKLVRGSGLFVGETGVAANHHFLAPRDGNAFRFIEGRYRLEVFVHLLGDRDAKVLFSQDLEIPAKISAQLTEPDAGLYFDWGPDSSRYLTHVETRPPSLDATDFLRLLGSKQVGPTGSEDRIGSAEGPIRASAPPIIR